MKTFKLKINKPDTPTEPCIQKFSDSEKVCITGDDKVYYVTRFLQSRNLYSVRDIENPGDSIIVHESALEKAPKNLFQVLVNDCEVGVWYAIDHHRRYILFRMDCELTRSACTIYDPGLGANETVFTRGLCVDLLPKYLDTDLPACAVFVAWPTHIEDMVLKINGEL